MGKSSLFKNPMMLSPPESIIYPFASPRIPPARETRSMGKAPILLLSQRKGSADSLDVLKILSAVRIDFIHRVWLKNPPLGDPARPKDRMIWTPPYNISLEKRLDSKMEVQKPKGAMIRWHFLQIKHYHIQGVGRSASTMKWGYAGGSRPRFREEHHSREKSGKVKHSYLNWKNTYSLSILEYWRIVRHKILSLPNMVPKWTQLVSWQCIELWRLTFTQICCS